MLNLCLVVPCFNEEEVIKNSVDILVNKIKNLIGKQVLGEGRILLVGDGSTDKTWNLIKEMRDKEKSICGISFSRNFGYQNAVLAGMMEVVNKFPEVDVIISIDADLQQDVNAIDLFIEKYCEGNEIVYGVRNNRQTDGILKKASALIFYQVMKFLGSNTIKNHADYRLVSRKVLLELEKYGEVNLFLRGLIPLIGFKSDIVYFDVFSRSAGKSKYNLSKMMTLAIDGITSLSIRSIRIISTVGIVALIISLIQLLSLIIDYIKGADTVRGWASIVCLIWFFGGMILFSLGIIGEYIGKIYLETKHRPRYIIKDRC